MNKHCEDDDGTPHYHCVYCGCVCSAQGHANGCPPPEQRPAWAKRYIVLKTLPVPCEIEKAYTDLGGEG